MTLVTVYPRWRGEHKVTLTEPQKVGGLSPLARGTRSDRYLLPGTERFIPAGAGNTYRIKVVADVFTVYPRWRGEHDRKVRRRSRRGGLSPLARGTHTLIYSPLLTSRFIPAGAGNTRAKSTILVSYPVYPRWRGEHCIDWSIPCPSIGLSPLARGTLTCTPPMWCACRFIPAGAGNTQQNRLFFSDFAVYPRWRGEH